MKDWYPASELEGLPGLPGNSRNIRIVANRKSWQSRKRQGRGGGSEYRACALPPETQAALQAREMRSDAQVARNADLADKTHKVHTNTALPTTPETESAAAPETKPAFNYDAKSLWAHFETKPEKQRTHAAYKHALITQAVELFDRGVTKGMKQAIELVANEHHEAVPTILGWWYGTNGKPGARHYRREDWLAALCARYVGRTVTSGCSAAAWDWFLTVYLDRKRPSLRMTYRRLIETAQGKNPVWVVPCERTLSRKLEKEISIASIIYRREGMEKVRQISPSMVRDKRCFAAGEAVSGDGMKFDRLWVDWGDEIINTTTGWFWQDIHSGKYLAHRIAKTENTDMFRLATYDLTAICLPYYIQVDNTRVAANKAMTGQAPGRHRFKNQVDDPVGILLQLGSNVHFTNPDHEVSNPGVKPVERSFGIGGIHEAVATHPSFMNRGHSKSCAIPVDEFIAVVADEVKRHNARPGRRSPICGGVLSFDQAFERSFSTSIVRRAVEAQRRLLLLMPEVVTANRKTGEIVLDAGRSPHGRNRYWTEMLSAFAGKQLVVYYDPEHLDQSVTVHTLDGRRICEAEHLPSHAFNDTVAAREWAKQKRRRIKAQKKTAAAEIRMTGLEAAALYPKAQDPTPPEPGVVRGHFSGRRVRELDDAVVDTETGEILNPEQSVEAETQTLNFRRAVNNLASAKRAEWGWED